MRAQTVCRRRGEGSAEQPAQPSMVVAFHCQHIRPGAHCLVARTDRAVTAGTRHEGVKFTADRSEPSNPVPSQHRDTGQHRIHAVSRRWIALGRSRDEQPDRCAHHPVACAAQLLAHGDQVGEFSDREVRERHCTGVVDGSGRRSVCFGGSCGAAHDLYLTTIGGYSVSAPPRQRCAAATDLGCAAVPPADGDHRRRCGLGRLHGDRIQRSGGLSADRPRPHSRDDSPVVTVAPMTVPPASSPDRARMGSRPALHRRRPPSLRRQSQRTATVRGARGAGGCRAARGFSRGSAGCERTGRLADAADHHRGHPGRARRGLMGVTDFAALGGYAAMVFIFSEDTRGAFGMRDTPLPLRINFCGGRRFGGVRHRHGAVLGSDSC